MKLLLVDDHALFREGLKYVLVQLDEHVEVVECGRCSEAFSIIEKDKDFDLILLDVDLPDMSGLEGLQKLREIDPSIPIVFLSGSEEGHLIRKALDLGVMGYIPKSQTSEIMIQALQLILKGGRYIPDHVLRASADEKDGLEGLTARQKEILELITQGKSNKEIANVLGIADNTVRVHISAIFQLLKVNNRTEAALKALHIGHK